MTDTLPTYPQTKESGVPWLGEIPAHWEVLPGFAGYRTKQVKNTGLIEDQVLSLSYGRIVIRPVEKLHGLVPASFETYQLVDPGNIIIRPTDLQNDWNSLRVGIARDKGIITSAYICLKTVGQMSSEYGYLLLNAYDLMKIFYGMGSGLRQNLDYNSDLKRMPILLPPPSEQTAIARYLDYVDRRVRRYIKAKRRLIEVLTEQKQAIIHQAVTRGLDPDVPMKASGVAWLGQVPAHWEVGPLKRFVARRPGAIKAGPFGSQLTAADMTGADVKVYTQRNVIDRDLEKGVNYVSDTKFETMRAFEVFPGDVLVTSRGTIGRTALVTENCQRGILHPCLLRVHPDQGRLYHMYLMALIQDSQLLPQQLTLLSNATTIDVIYSGTLANIIVPLPPIEEQQAIVRGIDARTASVSKAVTKAQYEIDLIREYRTRLIADVVTGKVDVRGAAAALGEDAGFDMSSAEQDEAWDEDALDEEEAEDEEMGEEVEA